MHVPRLASFARPPLTPVELANSIPQKHAQSNWSKYVAARSNFLRQTGAFLGLHMEQIYFQA